MKSIDKFLYLITTFVLFAFNSYGQTDFEIHKNQIKFSPVKMIDPINTGIEISYERRTGNFSTQIATAYLTDIFRVGDFRQLKGFRIGLEEKYFLNSSTRKIFQQTKYNQPYFSIDVAYTKVDYKFTAIFGTEVSPDEPLLNEYKDDFGVKKQKIVLNFKYGLQKRYNNFVFDFSFGIGLKCKNVKHYDRDNPTDKMQNSRHPNVFDSSNNEMKGFTLNIPANVKIGYVF